MLPAAAAAVGSAAGLPALLPGLLLGVVLGTSSSVGVELGALDAEVGCGWCERPSATATSEPTTRTAATPVAKTAASFLDMAMLLDQADVPQSLPLRSLTTEETPQLLIWFASSCCGEISVAFGVATVARVPR
ncbi:hypothetical protein GCM10009744_16480 [Kribbella alba]|uniref:Secreted protein n=1 Tax=Kribbella alba TaxID=190197 RepID=A0ABN2F510_9ACTN